MQTNPHYWFPAKRYGWGWGLPIAWQGWLSLVMFIGLVLAGALLFPPKAFLAQFLIYVIILSIAFAALCWWKGEPPRWRWGDDR